MKSLVEIQGFFIIQSEERCEIVLQPGITGQTITTQYCSSITNTDSSDIGKFTDYREL